MDNQAPQPTASAPVVNQSAQPVRPAEQKPPKPFFLNKIFLLVIVLIVLFAGGGIYFVLNSRPKPTPAISQIIPPPTSKKNLNPNTGSVYEDIRIRLQEELK